MSFNNYIRRKEEKLHNGAKYLRVGEPRRNFASLAKFRKVLRNGDSSHEIRNPVKFARHANLRCEFEMLVRMAIYLHKYLI